MANEGHSKVREMLIRAMLIAFTMVFGLFCVVVLSCTLAQTRMSGIAIKGINVSIRKLDDLRKQWTDIRDQINDQSDALAAAKTQRSEAKKKAAENDLIYRPARTALDQKLEEFNFRVRPFDEALAKAMSGQSPAEQAGRLEAAKESLKAHPELLPLIENIAELYKTYEPIGDVRVSVTAAVRAATARVTRLEADLKSLRALLDGLFSQISRKPIDDPTRSRVENALFELYSRPGVFSKAINSLIVSQLTFAGRNGDPRSAR